MSAIYSFMTILRVLTRPSLLVPDVSVRNVANIDFVKLKRAGYGGVIFDRDNCLTKPRKDELVPSLQNAWDDCLRNFGSDRVLIVSNSAGTPKDASLLQAESLTRKLTVPVLIHNVPKPFCVKQILGYFATQRPISLDAAPNPAPQDTAHSVAEVSPLRLVVIGDRLSTDVVLAKRLPHALSIWTREVWEEESPGVRVARLLENAVLAGVRRWRGAADQQKALYFTREQDLPIEPVQTEIRAAATTL